MTVLERIRANPGTARILVAHLASLGGRYQRTQLLHQVAPRGAGDYESGASGDALDESFDVCVSFGLIRVDEGDAVLEVDPSKWEKLHGLASFRCEARRALFAAVKDKDPFSTGLPKFAGAVAWFLCQDPLLPIIDFTLPAKPRQSVFGLQQEQLRHADHLFGQDRPWWSFVRWAAFLGFLEIVRTRSRHEVWTSDPTTAVRDEIIQTEGGPAAAVLADLSARLPVLDGGTVRLQVEDRLRPGSEPAHVSRSLTMALLRLEREGVINFRPAADAVPADRAVLHLGTETRTVSTIELVRQ